MWFDVVEGSIFTAHTLPYMEELGEFFGCLIVGVLYKIIFRSPENSIFMFNHNIAGMFIEYKHQVGYKIYA